MPIASVTCESCRTTVAVYTPARLRPKPFPCPGCSEPLTAPTGDPEPSPQADTSDTPAVQAVIQHFRGG